MKNFNYGIKGESKQFTITNEMIKHLDDKVKVIDVSQEYAATLPENIFECIIPQFKTECNYDSSQTK